MRSTESVNQNGIDEFSARFFFPNILGSSPDFLNFLNKIYSSSQNNDPLLLIGETGTGKSLYSKKIWELGSNKNGPFISLDCSDVHNDMTLSILQGHIRGSFTGAYNDVVGKIEESDGGVLVVENVENLNAQGQSVLCNYIDTGTVQRLGDTYRRNVRTKLVITSSGSLKDQVLKKLVEKKLYYRLLKNSIVVPSLKTLKYDLVLIAKRYCNEVLNVKISQRALKNIQNYDFPGNFRELFSCLESVSKYVDEEIGEWDVLSYINSIKISNSCKKIDENTEFSFDNFNLDAYMNDVERFIVEKALEHTQGVQSNAAKLLGIKERSLWHRVKTLGITIKKY
ncbi:sigma-54-dependent transcriptional regulator [Desulfovibrio sp. TomC]|uniref:sigma-54-dependent transcriptional regulator n=1 Tax=Desulfovibrio sp. TomC TaxID=1562888 RepID=UPI0018CE9CD9|nr:sigma 54-interacting transcriptional regulator [Desulfovibrio sp. TomC]